MDLQFSVNALHVSANRVDAASQLSRGRFVGVAVDQHFQQAQLVRGQMIIGPLRRANMLKQRDYAAGHFG